ncbi:MAG: hypothetical protein ABI746_02175 [Dermatophilaceae bacterium]
MSDVAVDWVVTRTRALSFAVTLPGRVFWDLILETEHVNIPPIVELAALREDS